MSSTRGRPARPAKRQPSATSGRDEREPAAARGRAAKRPRRARRTGTNGGSSGLHDRRSRRPRTAPGASTATSVAGRAARAASAARWAATAVSERGVDRARAVRSASRPRRAGARRGCPRAARWRERVVRRRRARATSAAGARRARPVGGVDARAPGDGGEPDARRRIAWAGFGSRTSAASTHGAAAASACARLGERVEERAPDAERRARARRR